MQKCERSLQDSWNQLKGHSLSASLASRDRAGYGPQVLETTQVGLHGVVVQARLFDQGCERCLPGEGDCQQDCDPNPGAEDLGGFGQSRGEVDLWLTGHGIHLRPLIEGAAIQARVKPRTLNTSHGTLPLSDHMYSGGK